MRQEPKTELQHFDEVVAECRDLFIRKNAGYGATYRRKGVLGLLVRGEDKDARAWNLLINGVDSGDESIRDTLRDRVNYAILAVMEADRGNLKGDQ